MWRASHRLTAQRSCWAMRGSGWASTSASSRSPVGHARPHPRRSRVGSRSRPDSRAAARRTTRRRSHAPGRRRPMPWPRSNCCARATRTPCSRWSRPTRPSPCCCTCAPAHWPASADPTPANSAACPKPIPRPRSAATSPVLHCSSWRRVPRAPAPTRAPCSRGSRRAAVTPRVRYTWARSRRSSAGMPAVAPPPSTRSRSPHPTTPDVARCRPRSPGAPWTPATGIARSSTTRSRTATGSAPRRPGAD